MRPLKVERYCAVHITLPAILMAATIWWASAFMAHALALRREGKFRSFWKWSFFAVFPATFTSLYLAGALDVDMQTKNIMLGIVGAVIGAISMIFLGQIFMKESLSTPVTHEGETAASASAPQPFVSGNNNAVSFGQRGGITAQTYINQAPPPELLLISQSDWEADGDAVKKNVEVRLQNPGAASLVRITARGDGILGLGFQGIGMMVTGTGDRGDGWAYLELLTPSSIRGFFVRAAKPTHVKLETSFQ